MGGDEGSREGDDDDTGQAEADDGDAHSEASAAGEPTGHDGAGGDSAHAGAGDGEEAIDEVELPDGRGGHDPSDLAEQGPYQAAGDGAGQHDAAWAPAVDQAADGHRAEGHESEIEAHGDGIGAAAPGELLDERGEEDAHGVPGHATAQEGDDDDAEDDEPAVAPPKAALEMGDHECYALPTEPKTSMQWTTTCLIAC